MFIRTESFRDFIRYYPAVTLIIFIQLLFYLLSVIPFSVGSWMMGNFSGINYFISHGEYWRLFTPIFLHSGFTHLLFNSFALLIVGPALEKRLAKGKFLFLYVLSGFAGNLATYIIEPLSYSHTGSSGAILGLFGFYVAILLYRKHSISPDYSRMIIALLALTLATGFLQADINMTSHFFGLVAGFLFGTLLYYNPKEKGLSNGRAGKWSSSWVPAIKLANPLKTLLWIVFIALALLGVFWKK